MTISRPAGIAPGSIQPSFQKPVESAPAVAETPSGMKVSRAHESDVITSKAPAESIVILGGTGSQGAALAYAASKSFGVSHNREIVIAVRGDAEKVKAAGNISVEADGKAHRLKDLKGVKLVSTDTLSTSDGRNTIAIATVPRKAVSDVLRSLPGNTATVVTTYNGVPLAKGQNTQHVVSVFPSFATPGTDPVYKFGPGQLVVDKASTVAKDLQAIFGSTFTITLAPNGHVAQWSKAATNTAVNSIATLLGIKVMDLRKLVESDPKVASLIKGVVAEIWLVARRQGVEVPFDDFHKGVIAKIPPTMDHFTSTGVSFRAGKSLGTDIDDFSAGISTLGKAERAGKPTVATPLCDALTDALQRLEKLRGTGKTVPPGFYEQAATRELGANLLSAEMLAHAESAIGEATSSGPIKAHL